MWMPLFLTAHALVIVAMGWQDLRHMQVDDRLQGAALLTGLVSQAARVGSPAQAAQQLREGLTGALVCGLPLLLLYCWRDDIGGADVKFAAIIGCLLGPETALLALLLGLGAALLGQLLLRRRQRDGPVGAAFPLLPWLVPPYLLLAFRQHLAVPLL